MIVVLLFLVYYERGAIVFVPKSFQDVGVTCSVSNTVDVAKVQAFKEANSQILNLSVKDRVKKGNPSVTVDQFLDGVVQKANANGGFLYVEDVAEIGGFSQLNPKTGSNVFKGILTLLMQQGYFRKKTTDKPVVNFNGSL